MNGLSTLLEQIIQEKVKDKEVALLLSGVVDSLSIGFAAHTLGKTIHAYSFTLEGTLSDDAKAAKIACNNMGWEYTLITVPRSNLEQDFIRLATQYQCKKKTNFECTFPFLYVIPEIHEKYVLSGICADNHFGLTKSEMMHYIKPKEVFDAHRRKCFKSYNLSSHRQFKMLCTDNGKIGVFPYLDPRIEEYFIQFSWEEINKPRQKTKTLEAYPELFKLNFVRPHHDLQICGGIDRLFETLIQNPRINTKNRGRVMDICRDWGKASA